MPGPLKPLIAIPTTACTGSETTGVAIFDFASLRAKTGIAHRRLRPAIGLIDPENTRALPPAVAASTGLEVLSHAADLSLMKNWELSESRRLQFRPEFFNAFNHPTFPAVSELTFFDTPSFGQILSANPPRQIQLALKFFW